MGGSSLISAWNGFSFFSFRSNDVEKCQKVKSLNSSTSWLVATKLFTPYLIQANQSNLFRSHLFFLPECRILKNSDQMIRTHEFINYLLIIFFFNIFWNFLKAK